MNFEEFAHKILTYYPPDDDVTDDFMVDYTRAIMLPKNYDYDKALIELMRTYKYRKLPTAADVVKALEHNEIEIEQVNKDTWQSGKSLYGWCERHKQWYEFVVCEGQTELRVTQSLVKKGFVDITTIKPDDATIHFANKKEKEKCA